MYQCVPLSSPGTPDAAATADTSDQHHKQEAYNSNDDDYSQGINCKKKIKTWKHYRFIFYNKTELNSTKWALR